VHGTQRKIVFNLWDFARRARLRSGRVLCADVILYSPMCEMRSHAKFGFLARSTGFSRGECCVCCRVVASEAMPAVHDV